MAYSESWQSELNNPLMSSMKLTLTSLLLAIVGALVITTVAYASRGHIIEVINPETLPAKPVSPSQGGQVGSPRAESGDVRGEVLAMLTEEGIDISKADRIIACESSWRPTAVNQNRNGSNDKGLWQLNSIHRIPDEVRLDPIKSTEEAIKLIKAQGFTPWVCQ